MRHRVHQIAACLLLVCLVLSTQGGLLARLLFEARRAYIAAEHCENRFEAASPCHGMCFLKKRLAEHEQHPERQAVAFEASPVHFYLIGSDAPPSPPGAVPTAYGGERPVFAPSGVPAPIDPPPRLV